MKTPKNEERVLTVTTAPDDYDWTGFGTREVEILGEDKHGRPIRVVSTLVGHWTEAQRGRFRSGLHLAVGMEDWEKVKSFTLAVEKKS